MKLAVSVLFAVFITAVKGQQDCSALANTGDCSFYACVSRRFGCSSTDYLLAYGETYCQRFEEQKNCFTTAGQTWITNVRTCLMRAIVNSTAYNDSSTTCAQLETIGFESHPSCYVDNGFCTDVLTNFENLICLANEVIDLRDFFGKQGVNQVLVTASRCAQNLIDQFLKSVNNFLSTSRAFLGTLRDYLGSCNSGIDMIFVLDASGSIGANNFATMKNFVTNVTSNFDIAPTGTRVGVILFSTSASIEISLGSINNNVSLINTINSILYDGGSTSTDLALDLLPTAFATARVSQGVPRVAVVLTDGQSNSPLSTIRSAAAVHAAGITVYSFGIGSGIKRDELVNITGNDTSNVFVINSFSSDSFATQLQPLRASTCTTPFSGDIGQELRGISLKRGSARRLQYPLPPEGLTISIDVQEGGVTVHGSLSIRNPTPLTADFTTQSSGDRDINYYVSPDLYESSSRSRSRRKRQTTSGEEDDQYVFLSVVGLMDGNNTFSLNTTIGDTSNEEGINGNNTLSTTIGDTVTTSLSTTIGDTVTTSLSTTTGNTSSGVKLGINLGLVVIMMFVAVLGAVM